MAAGARPKEPKVEAKYRNEIGVLGEGTASSLPYQLGGH